MAGLLGDVLPWAYSQGDRAKRYLGGLMADPAGTFQQAAGQMQDNRREMSGLLDQAWTDPAAQQKATQMALGGLLGISPAGMTAKVGGMSEEALKALRDKWAQQGVKLDLYGGDRLTLSRIEVPKDMRGQGVGSSAMQDVARYADENGKVVSLSPSTDFGASSVARLKDFYKRFGFVENGGKNKDFEISESMYRKPVSNAD